MSALTVPRVPHSVEGRGAWLESKQRRVPYKIYKNQSNGASAQAKPGQMSAAQRKKGGSAAARGVKWKQKGRQNGNGKWYSSIKR